MKKLILFSLLLLCIQTIALAQRTQLRGTVVSNTNEPLFGATVTTSQRPDIGRISDTDGTFSLSLPRGEYNLIVSLSGCQTIDTLVNLNGSQQPLIITLQESAVDLEAVRVESKRADQRVRNIQIGVEVLDMTEMLKTPTLFGEKDIIKSITLLPGVKTDGDGSSGFQVRGGTSSQNLILLDDASIYSSGHVMGLFSVFNADALYNASLYKGLIPAQFGGATSAVLDISTKYGDKQKYKFGAEIGLLSAKISAEGPIVKDKASFLVAGRRSYFDLFLKLSEEYRQNTMNFYDVNAKIDYKPNQNNIIALTLFNGKDNMGLEELATMKWTNSAGTLNWFHKTNDKISSNTSAIASSYKSSNSIDINSLYYSMAGHINNYTLKHETKITPTENINIITGLQTTLTDLKSADWKIGDINLRERRNNWQNNLWANLDWQINDKIGISTGLRLDILSVMGGAPYYQIDQNGNITNTLNYTATQIVKTYALLEPRVSVNYMITPKQSLKMGYSRTSQHIHALRNSSMAMPFDRYAMTSNILLPQIADQTALGYTLLSKNNMFEFSAELYYKKIQNVYDYRDGKTFNSELEIESIILGGEGRSYGLEVLAKKNLGKFSGWIGYTLSWTETKINGINENQWYTASNDRRHDISVVGMYNISQNWEATVSWVYNTGQALTAPSAKYQINGETYYYYAEKNGYRAPAYHRLDISITNTKVKEKYTRNWSFGIYNAYNQLNPYMIMFQEDSTSATGTKAIQYSLFGILPFVSYGIRF